MNKTAHKIISIRVAPELKGVPMGTLQRSEGESDERYAIRAALFAELWAIPDDYDEAAPSVTPK